ncbi:MAG: helix-turn-helix domain-containing protein [Magnetospirillum sp.]|nr:helix-turn-helix domain-containing protein [Magnetospirillum sp.]
MPTVRLSADELRRRARANRAAIAATTEGDIARHAAEDGSATDDLDLDAAVAEGRLRAAVSLDVAEIRARTGLSQDRFAKAFHISPHTLRNWEQGRRVPEGPARALLMAIKRDPEAVMRALQA